MARFEEAYNIVINKAEKLNSISVPLEEAINKALAEDVYADIDMPSFNRSAMDGYACRKEDLYGELEVIETVAAGQWPEKKISKGKCIKIMTGAPVPEGADTVIMVEYTIDSGKEKIRFTGKESNANIAYKGEDVKQGELLLDKGTLLKPRHIALMAAAGCSNPLVIRSPKVGVISTGSELVEPSDVPALSQVRNSNAWQLIAQVKQCGAEAVYFGIVKDDPEETEKVIVESMRECDVTILTGGVSMGDFDFVPGILKRNNVVFHFEKLDVKPGRPTIFGTYGEKYVFGLPGNPVSAFVIFEMLVRPLLCKAMGKSGEIKYLQLPLAKSFSRKKADRLWFVPVNIENNRVTLTEFHGSGHIHSLSKAEGIMIVPEGINQINTGENVNVRPI